MARRTAAALRREVFRSAGAGAVHDAHQREEARDVVAARGREPPVLGELPEARARVAAPRPVDAPFADVVRRERERPVTVVRVEHREVAGSRTRRQVGLEPLVTPAVDDEAEAPRGHRDVDPDGRGAGREKEQKEGRWTQTHAAAKAIALPVASAAGWTDDLVSAPTE